jgi:hypothetical protein
MLKWLLKIEHVLYPERIMFRHVHVDVSVLQRACYPLGCRLVSAPV